MKRKLFVIVISIIALLMGMESLEEIISNQVVHHIESNNFINVDDLDLNKITMVHSFSKVVQIYSEDKKEIFFTVINPYKGFTLYKNKKFVMQNQSPNYPMYENKDHIVFYVDREDYINNRVDFYVEGIEEKPEFLQYGNNYFVGSYSSVNNLIISKKCINVMVMLLLLISTLIMIMTNRKQIHTIMLSLGSLLMIYNFEVGIFFAVIMIYSMADQLLKKRVKKYMLPLVMILSILLSYNLFAAYSFIFALLGLINYFRNPNIKSIISLIALVFIFGLARIDIVCSIFRLYYRDVFITAVAIFMIINSILKLKMYFSKEKMVRVDLLRGVSHDLRLPLSTIKLNTELLEKDDFKSEINKSKILHVTKEAINDLVNMTSSLTAYISKDNYVDHKLKTSIQDCIEHTVSYFKNNEKKIEISMNLCHEELYLPIDRIWLNRLIYNLVDNSYKYTDEYGQILITLGKEKHRIVLSIEDDGIGMSLEQQSKVIEPFYRVDKSRSISGLGLGLSIVKTIVDKIDGDMEIDSELGVYTKFTIRI
ncbi:MAG: HAMP domain-containing histidine kinase [Maledivibacter sp.]|jgi:signal transduction histidine kinase|nr:HAMP domain-containing histidine kinase [Maledivibacter sp.]